MSITGVVFESLRLMQSIELLKRSCVVTILSSLACFIRVLYESKIVAEIDR